MKNLNLDFEDFLEARKYLGFSVLAVGKITGINRNNLSNYEKGIFKLTGIEIQRLHDFYVSRGYEFEDLNSDISDDDFQDLLDSEVKIISSKFGDELASSINVIFDALLNLKEKEVNLNEPEISYIPSDTEMAILEHFKIDAGEGHGVDYSFFSDESRDSRAIKICAGMAGEFLKNLESKYPDVFISEPVEDSDLFILRDFVKQNTLPMENKKDA